jgi:hypothetical protein
MRFIEAENDAPTVDVSAGRFHFFVSRIRILERFPPKWIPVRRSENATKQ